MICVTGSAGFIGGALVRRLKELGEEVIQFDRDSGTRILPISLINEWFKANGHTVKAAVHLGAITDTRCQDWEVLVQNNTFLSEKIWLLCTEYKIPLVYASSAAVYGNGQMGMSDDHELNEDLEPLNLYAITKHMFDKFALKLKNDGPPKWYGLRFFNVYGFNESHKGHMASMVYHGRHQVKEVGFMSLFRGSQGFYRDFIYVEDVLDIILWLIDKEPESGIYNVGTGMPRSFYELAVAVNKALRRNAQIKAIPMPEDLLKQYQQYTRADITKLRAAGYDNKFTALETGVRKTIQEYEDYHFSVQS